MRQFILLFTIISITLFNGQSQQDGFMPGLYFTDASNQANKLNKEAVLNGVIIPISQNFEIINSEQRGGACTFFDGGPYFDLEIPPCESSCGTPLGTGFQVWGNEAYVVTGTAGSQYTLEFCSGYDASTWSAIITIAEYSSFGGVVPNTVLTSTSGCSITFTTPEDKKYIVIISEENACGSA